MEDNSVVCYEKWDLDRLATIQKLTLPKEIGNQLRKIRLEPDVPRLRVRYTTKRGDPLSRLYGNLVYHGPSYKRRKIESKEGYVYESTAHPMEDEYYGGSSLQTLPVWVRRLVAHEYYRDFDIVNCAPTLLAQILENEGMPVPAPLKEYNTDRNALFEKYRDVGEIKTAFLEVIHMGKVRVEIRETAQLKTSLRSALLRLSKHNTHYEALYLGCIKKVMGKQKYNILDAYSRVTKALGKFCAIVWQRQEHRVLMAMRRYFIEDAGCDPRHMVLAFDGIMVEKDEEKKIYVEAMCARVRRETGYAVQIVEKSLTPVKSDWDVYYGRTVLS